MNAPLQVVFQTAQTVYAVLINPADGTVWNNVTPGWEAYNSGHWAQYAVALAEYPSSGYYRAAYPIASPTVLTTDLYFSQGGGSPALGDPAITGVQQSQGVNVAAAGNSFPAGQNFAAVTGSEQVGAISVGPSTSTVLATDLSSTTPGTYAGSAIRMTSGALKQQTAFITGYDGAGNVTINGFPGGGIPANGDAFVIL